MDYHSIYLHRVYINWALKQENLLLLHANNKGADQPEHKRSLIIESKVSELSTCNVF